MPETALDLNEKERDYLVGLLERVLKDARVEEHRTRTPIYRELVLNKEELIKSVLAKLGKPAA